jgi:hypothetical protein
MRNLTLDRSRTWRAFVAALVLGAMFTLGAVAACNDTPGAPTGPGNVLINDTNEDAVAHLSQDATVNDVYAPQGAGDAAPAYDGTFDGAAGMGYADVQSPQAACASCKCDQRVGYCLENGSTTTLTDPPPTDGGECTMGAGTPAIGCNVLPAACASMSGQLACACVLDNIKVPNGCYAQCTTSLGYIDVYCPSP